jgi:TetR/AcrR family transcriptional regulator
VPREARDSRQAILVAAAAEFAARGFSATGVDRIARRAGVNKAMIYYHFGSKQRLYRDVVRELVFAIRARTRAVAAGRAAPGRKVSSFIEAFVREAQARPHMPAIMMREVAEGGRHLDAGTLRVIAGVFESLLAILEEGRRTGAFTRVHPLLMYFTIIGPTVMFFGSGPIRRAILRLAAADFPEAGPEVLIEHLNRMATRTLAPSSDGAGTPARAGTGPRSRSRSTTTRSGERA